MVTVGAMLQEWILTEDGRIPLRYFIPKFTISKADFKTILKNMTLLNVLTCMDIANFTMCSATAVKYIQLHVEFCPT